MKRLMILMAVGGVLLFAPLKTYAGNAAVGLADQLLLWGSAAMDSSSSDKEGEKKKEGDVDRLLKEISKDAANKKGIKITFGPLYEKIIINERTIVLTFEGTVNNNPTVISLGFHRPWGEKGYKSFFYVYWDDLAEYKSKSSKKSLATRYIKRNLDIGPINEEDPQKTPETTTTPQPALAPQPVTPATATPETPAPADTAPPAPSTALSNNP